VTMVLCFAIALEVLAFVLDQYQGLKRTTHLVPASFKAGTPPGERRTISFYSIDGQITYINRGEFPEASLSPDCAPSPVNGAYGETSIVGPPRLWQSFQSPSPRHSSTYGGTLSIGNALTNTGVISGPQRVDSFYRNDPSPLPVSIYLRASTIRPSAGEENSSTVEDRSSTFSELKRDALSSP